MAPSARDLLLTALRNEQVRARYWSKVARPDIAGFTCWPWIGSLHPKGHGRFWIGTHPNGDGTRRDVCVIAHRFGYALAYGGEALADAVVLAHTCDEPSCQNPGHLMPSSAAENLAEWQSRRWSLGSPLRDVRGPGGRAIAIRRALLEGGDLRSTLDAGLSALDTDQMSLW